MITESVPIESLSQDPSNVREHGVRNVEAIKASLLRFGQQKPIVVDADGVVVAGNGTLGAAKILGWSSLDVVRTELHGAEAVAFAIADNRTAELATWDNDELLLVLQQMDEPQLEAAGYNEQELADLLKTLNPPTEQDWADAFDESGDMDGLEREQITITLSAQDMERVKARLRSFSNDKNEAILLWLDS